jgi:demethylmenaquinone methyltransferase/2-methoxy-6-polyprenyl-1,4-benzoquinol methylase
VKVRGTTPPEAATEQEAAQWVRGMFGAVAPRYDFLNHLLSMNVDRWWRARAVKRVRDILERPDARALDLCCGTCDLLRAMERAARAETFGADFSHPMLTEARKKHLRSPLFEADALEMPLREESFDLITCAFGFRNLANYRRGLEEIHRVLRPGGAVAILEFSTPPNRSFAALYAAYSRHVLPRIGAAISGSKAAYEYLPESVRKFPGAEDLAEQMHSAGFREVAFERMTFGIVALHTGIKPPKPGAAPLPVPPAAAPSR